MEDEEKREVRFGVTAVRKGYVTPEQVVDALGEQVREDLSAGGHRPIGRIFVEGGLMDLSQLREVLEFLKEKG